MYFSARSYIWMVYVYFTALYGFCMNEGFCAPFFFIILPSINASVYTAHSNVYVWCARLCVHVPYLMGEGDLLGTILISIINHRECHFQIPFPLPNLLNLILYHSTKPSMRDGSDNVRWLAYPCSTVQGLCQPGDF